jgi:hypothetical protein
VPEVDPKPFAIFRAGRHTAADGRTLDFSEADMAAAASAYDPAVYEAPIVVGHPRDTAPAFGWIAKLEFAGGQVSATPRQVNADFAEQVRMGAYKKVSASWYLPDAPANPKPGVHTLRHVGFLGAQPPALKGLPPVEFAAGDEEGTVTVEFAEMPAWRESSAWRTAAGLLRRLREWMIADRGAEAADKAMPAWDIDELERMATAVDVAAAASAAAPPPSFAEPPPTPEPKQETLLAIEDEKKAADFAEREAGLAKREAALARSENAAFLAGLVAEGRPLPAPEAQVLDFMEAIAGGGIVDFGETGGKLPAVGAFKAMLKALPKQVDFSERAGGDSGDGDINPADVARQAVAFQEEQQKLGLTITTTEAVARVTKAAAGGAK